jgi:hypothetical protein
MHFLLMLREHSVFMSVLFTLLEIVQSLIKRQTESTVFSRALLVDLNFHHSLHDSFQSNDVKVSLIHHFANHCLFNYCVSLTVGCVFAYRLCREFDAWFTWPLLGNCSH